MRVTRIAAAVATAALVVGTGALVSPANASHGASHGQKPAKVSGTTTVATDPGIANALLGAGLVVLATAPGSTQVRGGLADPSLAISFPVTGAGATIDHKGALVIVNPSKGKAVTLGDLKISLTQGTISGNLNGTGYVPAFTIDASKAKVVKTKQLTRYSNVGVSLNAGVAATLNTALATDVFKDTMRIGTATVTVKTK